MKKVNYLFIMLAFASLTACGLFNAKSFDETESGIKYRFHITTGNQKPDPGDILSLNMVYSIKDSVLFDNMLSGTPVYLPYLDPQYPGDIFEALSMMAVGDSATFLIDASNFYLYTAGMMEVPDFVKGIVNLRGKIIPVIDVRLKFRKNAVEYNDRTCIIVVDIQGVSIGLIVDRVAEVLSISDEYIVPPPSAKTGFQNRYIKGVGKVGDDVKLLLHCEKLLDDGELSFLEEAVD